MKKKVGVRVVVEGIAVIVMKAAIVATKVRIRMQMMSRIVGANGSRGGNDGRKKTSRKPDPMLS